MLLTTFSILQDEDFYEYLKENDPDLLKFSDDDIDVCFILTLPI